MDLSILQPSIIPWFIDNPKTKYISITFQSSLPRKIAADKYNNYVTKYHTMAYW